MIHKVHITQSFRVHAEITIEVEADTLDEAIDIVDEGLIDKPDFETWEKTWELMNEEVWPA